MKKPPFQPLTMKEVNEKKNTNGYNVVSTFSGAGGSCLGLKLAGFNIKYAVEFVPAAQEVYQLNHPDTYLDKRDIREIKGTDILKTCKINKGELDLFEGSPPCSGFSQSGLGTKGWNCIKNYSDTKQRVDDLFFEFIRLINETQPKMILAENVPALATGKNKGMLKLIINSFKEIGYNVNLKVLDANYLNVPQKRKRLIFIGKKEGLPIKIEFPKPINYNYTVGDAIPNFYNNPHPKDSREKLTELEKIMLKDAQKHKENDLSKANKRINNKDGWFTKQVIYKNKPSSTLMATQNIYHGKYLRTVSITEAKRLQTFPDDFKLTGNYIKQWERIGRSVPPRMYEAVGKKIKQSLDDYNDTQK